MNQRSALRLERSEPVEGQSEPVGGQSTRERADFAEGLQTRFELIEALYRLSVIVARTSDLKALPGELNREIGTVAGVECVRLCFSDNSLAEFLGVPAATESEREQMQRWRRGSDPFATVVGNELAIPLPLQHRTAGILWVRLSVMNDVRIEIAKAMATGVGEVAYKAKLRRTVNRRAQELAVAADRENIARDLHDTVGQTLYAIGLQLQDLLCETQDEKLVPKLTSLRALASQGVADLRSAVYSLSFLHVREHGFVSSLRALTQQFKRTTGVTAQLRIPSSMGRLPREVENGLYRVVHEALVNVEQHARATGVVISIEVSNRRIDLTILDDGVGLSQRQVQDWRSSTHFGIRTMTKSIEEIGGSFRVSQRRPRGLLIEASAPIDDARAIR